jgi:putative (di)nucleoside polyphosphate hydrolase
VWQLPQGGIESTGSIEENAIREACEELGVEAQLLRVLKLLSSRHEYEWQVPPDYAIGRWRGQEQSFVVLEFLGEDKNIKLDRYASPEFDRYIWIEPANLLDVVETKRRAGYAKPLEEVLELLR